LSYLGSIQIEGQDWTTKLG